MSSQFDDLLGDLGDTSGSATVKVSGGENTGGEDSGLLLDFSAETEVTNGHSNGFAMDSSANPLYDLSSADDSQAHTSSSSNPLYDFDASGNADPNLDASAPSGNPLYDLTTAGSEPATSGGGGGDAPLFDFTAETDTSNSAANANPLYEFDAGISATTTSTFEEEEKGLRGEGQSDDLLSGTNGGTAESSAAFEGPGQSDPFADDALGGFVSDRDRLQEDDGQGQQVDYSGSEFNGGGGDAALFDLGPTGTTTTDQEETVTTTYQEEEEETPAVAPQEPEQVAEEALRPEEAETTEQAPPEEDQVPEEAMRQGEGEAVAIPDEVDLIVREDGDEEQVPPMTETTPIVEDQPEEPAFDYQYQEPVSEPEPERTEGDGLEAETEQPVVEELKQDEIGQQDQAQASDSTSTDGAYHADRREEDLEQYCMYREEETSEVSDGAGEASGAGAAAGGIVAASEDGDRRDATGESGLQEADQSAHEIQREEEQLPTQDQFVEDQAAVVSSQAEEEGPEEVSELEEKEPPAVVEEEEEAAPPPQQQQQQEEEEGEGGPQKARPTSFTSSSSIVLLASPTSPNVPSPQEGRPQPSVGSVTIAGTVSIPSQAAVMASEEEIIQDGHTISKTTRTENRYSSGSGFEDSRITEEATSTPVQADYSKKTEPVMSTQPTPAPRGQQPSTLYDDDDDDEEEGVYENEPERRDDLVRESDKKEEENLPAAGTAQNLKAKFLATQQQAASSTPRAKREITPPNPTMGGGEYVSEPREHLQQYEGRADSGVFESQPVYDENVVRSGLQTQEIVPEHGTARSTVARYAQLESKKHETVTSSSHGKRELTPDRAGRVEYVSEPRDRVEHYEGKAESGVFESQPVYDENVIRSDQGVSEKLPERGTAKSLVDRYRQINEEKAKVVTSSGKRELTPDKSGRVEYVSEPRESVHVYESRTESGVFENQPQEEADVVKAASAVEEYVPERGYTKNVAARFKELESTAKSPPPVSPGRRKEFTPPREDRQTAGVFENKPQSNPEVVTSAEPPPEIMPEQGTAKNIAQRFRQLEAESKSPPSAKPKKEFTPPPRDAGVFENQPERFQADYNRPAESGILENNPQARAEDVTTSGEPPKHTEELPERGTAKNLLNRWKQLETEKGKSPGSGTHQKEFTPPREEPRIAQQSRSPRTPKSPPASASMDNGSVHPSDLPGQYQPQDVPHVIESTPEVRSDVTREADTDRSQGMPKKNTAKKMLARFQNIQAGANKDSPRPEARKESETETTDTSTTYTTSGEEDDPAAMQSARLKFEDPDKVSRSKSMKAAIQVEKCGACDKTVYAMERLEMNKQVYHRACFRCSQCKSVLTAKTFAINNGIIFCTTHYKQLFTRKGNYDEGFGRSQHKTRWNSNPDIAEAVKKEAEADAS